MIYFMQPYPEGGPVKIGFTDDLKTRHRTLEAHYGRTLAILWTMAGDRDTEREIHLKFDHLRYDAAKKQRNRPEQFKPDREIFDFIGLPLFASADPGAVKAMIVTKRYGKLIRISEEAAQAIQESSRLEGISTKQFADRYLLHVTRQKYRESILRIAARLSESA